jgi:hypothetical protein
VSDLFVEIDGKLYPDPYEDDIDSIMSASLVEADSSADFPVALGRGGAHEMQLGSAPKVDCLFCTSPAKFLVVNHMGVRPACAKHVEQAKDDDLASVRLLDPYESKFLTDTKVHIEKPGSKIPNHYMTEQGNLADSGVEDDSG